MSAFDNQIIDLNEIKKDIELAKVEGKNVVINERADYLIAKLKEYELLIEDTIKLIKSYVPDVLNELNSKSMKGRYCTVSLRAPGNVNKYKVDEDVSTEFITKTTKIEIKPNVDSINKFYEENGHLPLGVHLIKLEPVVSIRAKTIEPDEDDIPNYE